MTNRHLARSIVLQTLFEWDTAGRDHAGAREALARNIAEFSPQSKDTPFMERTLEGILAKRDDIDLIIEKAAPEWPLPRIAPVDRNILRLGLYELLFADRAEVPAKVAINEAIELAKSYGGESSSRFVNGVLGAVYKELGEPGKEDSGKKRQDPKEYPVELLGGVVVYAREEGQVYVALVHDVFGHWTLSKGHIEKDATPELGVARVAKEELGLSITVEDQIGANEYVANHPEKGKIRKKVVYFLAQSSFEPLTLKKTGGLDDAKWFRVNDILDLNFYSDMLPVITNALQTLAGKTPVPNA